MTKTEKNKLQWTDTGADCHVVITPDGWHGEAVRVGPEGSNVYRAALRQGSKLVLNETCHGLWAAKNLVANALADHRTRTPDPEPEAPSPEVLALTPDDLGLGIRAWNALYQLNARTVADIIRLTEKDIYKQRNAGRKTLKEIKEALAELGLSLKGPPMVLQNLRPKTPAPKPPSTLVTEQTPPTPNAHPAVWPLVLDDMEARDTEGRRKYGVPLQPHNGRDTLIDLYQELLDAVVYTRTLIYERDGR